MPHAFFVSYGSYGDVFPFLAVAQRLSRLGVTCTFVTDLGNIQFLEKAGFKAHGILPSDREMFAKSRAIGKDGIPTEPSGTDLLWQDTFRRYSSKCDVIEDLARDADVIVCPTWTYNAHSVSEKCGIPMVGVHLWPMYILSPSDPPIFRRLPQLIQTPKSRMAITWNRALLHLMKRVLARRHSPTLNQFRMEYGLKPVSRAPLFEFQSTPVRTVTLISKVIAPANPINFEGDSALGFPFIQDPSKPLDPDLQSFLKTRPIIFSLGSIVSTAPGAFYHTAAAVARRLGREALLVMDNPDQIEQCALVKAVGYAPHADIFPDASVIVHHGGIGTTAHAMASGRPQLVVPFFGDQPDNAARLKRLGVAEFLAPQDFTEDKAADVLAKLLANPSYAASAADVKTHLQQEDGAERAAEVIQDVIRNAA